MGGWGRACGSDVAAALALAAFAATAAATRPTALDRALAAAAGFRGATLAAAFQLRPPVLAHLLQTLAQVLHAFAHPLHGLAARTLAVAAAGAVLATATLALALALRRTVAAPFLLLLLLLLAAAFAALRRAALRLPLLLLLPPFLQLLASLGEALAHLLQALAHFGGRRAFAAQRALAFLGGGHGGEQGEHEEQVFHEMSPVVCRARCNGPLRSGPTAASSSSGSRSCAPPASRDVSGGWRLRGTPPVRPRPYAAT